MDEKTSILLVTANVGSIFEDPDVMLTLWVQEFLQTVVRLDPKFIALHCQEVGGKNYETRMKHVENFVQMLLTCEEMKSFDKAEIFLDEDFSCVENFTALGNFYFIHETLTDVDIWDFEEIKFQSINGKNVHSGHIEKVAIKEKSKFPQNFFPECKWSRKGFLRTRWSINGSVFDLVNIHLFHDASNFIAMQAYPSVYTKTRQKALQYTLNRFYNYEEGSAPFFLFGDFNFRTDTRGVVKKLTEGLREHKDAEGKEDEKLEYKDDTSEIVVTIGKKEFRHSDHQKVFIDEWLKEFDLEMEAFKDQLFEYPIQFMPSYPFEESSTSGQLYMKTRCPAWCDRVLLSKTAKQLILERENQPLEYGVIGKDSCMGDHKPVYLFFNLMHGAGTIATQLPVARVCSACKLNSSVFCKAFDEPLVTALVASPGTVAALKCPHHVTARNDAVVAGAAAAASASALAVAVAPATYPSCSRCKKSHRSMSRCFGLDTSLSVMSVVTELSDRDVDSNDANEAAASATCAAVADNNNSTASHSSSSNSSSGRSSNRGSPKFKSCGHRVLDDVTNTVCSKAKLASCTVLPEDNVSLNYLQQKRDSSDFSQGPAVRSNSASIVVEGSWRNKTCTCLQDAVWRMRSVSSSSRNSSWTSDNRVRLKSDPNLKTSLPRIQSHHSSSDEEWFEEVTEEDQAKQQPWPTKDAVSGIEEYIEFDAAPSSSQENTAGGGQAPLPGCSSIEREEKSRKNRFR